MMSSACLSRRRKNVVGEVRINRGRNEKTTFVIVDAQSVKNTDTAEQKNYDAGKKVSGIKRHLAVDTQGLPHAIAVTTADVTDRAGALVAFSEHQDNLSAVKKVLVDGGYTGQPCAAAVRKMLGGDGRGCQTKRTAHIYSDAQAVGCRALFRLVRKMSTVMEKLRAKTQYQRAICDLGVSGLVNPKIVNRL